MTMLWLLPGSLIIGVVGTRNAIKARHHLKGARGDWWLLLILSWLPALLWMASHFVVQD